MAQAMLAKGLGLRRVFVLHERERSARRSTHAEPFGGPPADSGSESSAPRRFDPEAKSYDALAREGRALRRAGRLHGRRRRLGGGERGS